MSVAPPLTATARLALRLLARDWRAGELRVLAVALVIAIAAASSVGFFSDRVQRALAQQASALLGADLVVHSDRPFEPWLLQAADAPGLARTEVLRFPSMVVRGERAQLAEVRAVGAGWPLKGVVDLAPRHLEPTRPMREAPQPGTVWIDTRMVALLGIDAGETLELGEQRFQVAGVFDREAEASIGFLSMSPRVLLNAADLPATGLVQPASRIGYRLMLAGEPAVLAAFRARVVPGLAGGQRLEDVRDARPELRSALERAERFLGLAAQVAVILAGVAIALAARRYLQRHLDACAMMRCLGAPQRQMLLIHLIQFLALGAGAGLVGVIAGLAGQAVLAGALSGLVAAQLPAPGALPAWQGLATALVLLLGFGLPPLVSLARVPTLRVLRRDLGAPGRVGLLSWISAAVAVAGLVLWQAADLKLGGAMLGGVAALLAACAAVGALAVRLAGRVSSARVGFTWRYGIANLNRRALGTVVQVTALGLGLMALLLLTLVRGDLLERWRGSLPADTPNQFLVNIQPDQADAVRRTLVGAGVADPNLLPMVRGRLVELNGRAVQPEDYPDERTRRLVDRETNLSFTDRLQDDNVIIDGRWWTQADRGAPLVSMEEGIARRIGVRVGDRLVYDVAGVRRTFTVASLRRVEWDSFRTNFFVIMPPGSLDGLPVSYITSFRLPEGRQDLLNELVRGFPNLLIIDVAAVLQKVQSMIDQVARAVEFLMGFTLLAGLVVLYAALAATAEERQSEAAVVRTLGASTRQIGAAQAAEFATIGALAGLVAAIGSSVLAWVLARYVLSVPYAPDPRVWLLGLVGGALLVGLAGWIGTRSIARVPPLVTLRRS